MSELTDLQREILEAKRANPTATPDEIAADVDCSETYAREVLNEYDTSVLSETTAEDDGSSSGVHPFWILLAIVIAGYLIENGL
jgi:hypothetical protein